MHSKVLKIEYNNKQSIFGCEILYLVCFEEWTPRNSILNLHNEKYHHFYVRSLGGNNRTPAAYLLLEGKYLRANTLQLLLTRDQPCFNRKHDLVGHLGSTFQVNSGHKATHPAEGDVQGPSHWHIVQNADCTAGQIQKHRSEMCD